MSVSIYYTAVRDRPMTVSERTAVSTVVASFAVEDQIRDYFKTGDGPNWESFCVYDPTNPSESDVIFEGATRLPDNSEDAMWEGVQHWCQLLSIIRRTLNGARWRVHVDDHDIVWNDAQGIYDPSQ